MKRELTNVREQAAVFETFSLAATALGQLEIADPVGGINGDYAALIVKHEHGFMVGVNTDIDARKSYWIKARLAR